MLDDLDEDALVRVLKEPCLLYTSLSGLLERRQNRGMGGAKTQVMLCCIPNVCKSTFINTFAGSARAKAADRPGVTKGKQLSLIHISGEQLRFDSELPDYFTHFLATLRRKNT